MQSPQAFNEERRLEALSQFDWVKALPDAVLDDLAKLAALVSEAPIALISFLGAVRQWFLSRVGWAAAEMSREISICAQTILQPGLFLVPDASKDERFRDMPYVAGDPRIRSYAGAPLVTAQGHAIGTLCVMDVVPRRLSLSQREALLTLSRQVMAHLELRRQARELEESEARVFKAFRSCPIALTINRVSDGAFLEVNAAYCDLIGWAREEIIGHTADELQIVPETVVAQLRARLYALQMLRNEEVVIRTRTGEIRHTLIGTALVDLRGEPHAITTLVDITERQRAAEELRRNQAYLQTALELAGMGAWFWDFQSDEVRTIQGSGPISGLPEGLYPRTGSAVLAMVHPEDRALVEQRIESAKAGGDYQAEFRFVLSDQSIRWVAARGICLRDAAGSPYCLTGVDYDITEARLAEIRIQHLNRVYALLSGINQTIVRQGDPQTMLASACRTAVEQGRFRMAWIGLRAAPDQPMRVAAYAGASAETLRTLDSMFGPEPGSSDCAFTTHALQAGRHGVCNDIAGDPRSESWRALALQEGYRAMASLPLKRGASVIGTFNLYAGEQGFFDTEELRLLDELAMDIAFALEGYEREDQRRRVERALRESEERFRQLAENIQEVFWMMDPAGTKMLYVSPAYERIWGRSCASLYQTAPDRMAGVHPDDRARVMHSVQTKLASGEFDEIYRIERPDGTVRWIHDRAFPVRGATGEIVRIVGTAEDITARRQLEEQFRQAQKMEAIGRLAGGVAHDFNNLLTVIHGYGSMLMTAGRTPGLTDSAREIVRAAERAAGLTRQLLAFGRRQVMQAQWVDLNEIVSSVATMLVRILGEDVHLKVNLHPSPLTTLADQGMLEQVLMNLAVNARDAMPEGGRLSIETTEKDLTAAEAEAEADTMPDARPGRYVCVRVTDAGCGISAENLPHVFEPFFTTKEPGKGTGLGLATVFGIITQHGGFLHVETVVNRGTTFHVYLPAAAATAGPPAPEMPRPNAPGGTETILVVEDEPAVRRLTRVVLEQRGYRVFEAADGLEALRVWDQHEAEIQLVLTDIVLPEGMSGLDLANRLLERNAGLRIIFTSGYSADIAGRYLSLRVGQGFIQKPSSPRQLLETVRRALDT